jgi:hypothetical protein
MSWRQAMADDEASTISWLSPRIARWLSPLSLLLGVELWLLLGGGNFGRPSKPLILLVLIAVGLIPPINRLFNRIWEALAKPSPTARRWTAIVIWIVSSVFLYSTQRYENISLAPKWEDEFSYLIQMQMLARGHFWMPAIPLPQYFQTFYMFVTPVYASMYFPGAAMMYAPALALHLPYFIGPLAASGLCAAMIYLIFTEILDGASGLLAVLMLLCLPATPVPASMFRMMSIMTMAQTPALLLGLIMTWGVLRWRQKRNWKWLALVGAAGGWSAITRPADGLCFALVLGVVIVWDYSQLAPRLSSPKSTCNSQLLPHLAALVLPVIPFLILQFVINHNVTGLWFTTPFGKYNDINYPGVFGFHSGAGPRHVSDLPEAQFFYEVYAKGVIGQHRLSGFVTVGLKNQLEMIGNVAIPDPFFWLIMPLSLPAMWSRKLWAVWGMLPTFVLLLSPYAFSWVLPHYYLMVLPAILLLCLLPIRFLSDVFPRRVAMIRTMMVLPMIALAVMGMPQLNRLVHDQYFEPRELMQIDGDIAKQVTAPAVVMFHFNRGVKMNGKTVFNDPSQEPVFNADVAWPDDAPVIRAHDLNESASVAGKPGDRDRALYEYYARVDPLRVFYLYNRGAEKNRLIRLGTAAQMAQATARQQP